MAELIGEDTVTIEPVDFESPARPLVALAVAGQVEAFLDLVEGHYSDVFTNIVDLADHDADAADRLDDRLRTGLLNIA